jgi:polysaccharide biosynthesis protein PslH
VLKVLFAAPQVPWPLDCGGRIRTFKLLRELASRAEIHFRGVRQPELDDAGVRELERTCASVRVFARREPSIMARIARAKRERWFFSSELRRSLAAELARDEHDVVHLDEMVLVRALPDDVAAPVVVHHHKLDALVREGSSGVARHLDGLKLARLEAESARRTAHHVTCSDLDAAALVARYPGLRVGVVPNGFDPHYMQPATSGAEREHARLLFLGAMSYEPNVDAVVHFVRDTLPRIRARRADVALDIVGGDPAPAVQRLASDHVRVVGAVRDVRPYLDRAALLVAPLRIGSGTRLKVVDALACACPVVATTSAVEGLAFRSGEHLEIADGAAHFADVVVRMLGQRAHAARTAQRGLAFAHEHYRWSTMAERLLAEWRRASATRVVAPAATAC